MGNVFRFVNDVKNKLLFAVGYIVLQIAKPSCEYTARIVSKETSMLMHDQSFEIAQEREKILSVMKQHVEELKKLLDEIKRTIDELNMPDVEKIVKKYSLRLHDEHVQMLQVIKQ